MEKLWKFVLIFIYYSFYMMLMFIVEVANRSFLFLSLKKCLSVFKVAHKKIRLNL